MHLIIDDLYLCLFQTFGFKSFKRSFLIVCMVLIIWELINHFLGIAKTSVLFSTVVSSDYSISCQPFHQKVVVLVKQLIGDKN